MNQKGVVYALVCPKTNEIRYVGQTVSIEKRFLAHMYSVKDNVQNKNKELVKWIIRLSAEGLKPVVKILLECDVINLKQEEAKMIKELSKTHKLFNVANATEPTTVITFRVPKSMAAQIKKEALQLLAEEKANGYNS